MVKRQILLTVTKSLKFLACLVLLDLGLGGIHRHLFMTQTTGKFARLRYTMDSAKEDLLVFGSSHAAAHYVPAVLEDELGMTCYNAGVAGQQILVHQTLEEIVLHRTTPKLMILDLDLYGFFADMAQYDRLADLHPFYAGHAAIIGKVLSLESPLTRYFLVSKLYQYNSTIVHILRYALSPQPDEKGYQATFTRMARPDPPESRPPAPPEVRRIDERLVAALEEFAASAKSRGVPLVLAISPNVELDNEPYDPVMDRIRAVAGRYGLKLLDARNDPAYIGRYDLFADAGHLNDDGARLYSRSIAGAIRREFPALVRR